MTNWQLFGNDVEGDCVLAALANASVLWTGYAPPQPAVDAVFHSWCDVSGCDYAPVLRRAWWSGIGGFDLGGFARIKASQIPEAVGRFGCALVGIEWPGVGSHCVLVISDKPDGVTFVSWGKEVTVSASDFAAWLSWSSAIARKWTPILLWWSLRSRF